MVGLSLLWGTRGVSGVVTVLGVLWASLGPQKKTECEGTKPHSYPSQGDETELCPRYDDKAGGPSREEHSPEDRTGLEHGRLG